MDEIIQEATSTELDESDMVVAENVVIENTQRMYAPFQCSSEKTMFACMLTKIIVCLQAKETAIYIHRVDRICTGR